MTSFTLSESRREREGRKEAQYFEGSIVSWEDIQYKESKTTLISYATWKNVLLYQFASVTIHSVTRYTLKLFLLECCISIK